MRDLCHRSSLPSVSSAVRCCSGAMYNRAYHPGTEQHYTGTYVRLAVRPRYICADQGLVTQPNFIPTTA